MNQQQTAEQMLRLFDEEVEKFENGPLSKNNHIGDAVRKLRDTAKSMFITRQQNMMGSQQFGDMTEISVALVNNHLEVASNYCCARTTSSTPLQYSTYFHWLKLWNEFLYLLHKEIE